METLWLTIGSIVRGFRATPDVTTVSNGAIGLRRMANMSISYTTREPSDVGSRLEPR